MKKLITILAAAAVGLGLEGGLGNSHFYAGLPAHQKVLAEVGLAVVYLAGIAVLAVRHRAGQRDDRSRRSGFSNYR